MAYLAFSELGGTGGGAAAPAVMGAAAAPVFSALQWSVVALAWGDRPSSLHPPGRLARVLGKLFGGTLGGHNPRLADPALEALRRIAVLTWRGGYSVPGHEVRAFLAAGYTPSQYELLVDRIAEARAGGSTPRG